LREEGKAIDIEPYGLEKGGERYQEGKGKGKGGREQDLPPMTYPLTSVKREP